MTLAIFKPSTAFIFAVSTLGGCSYSAPAKVAPALDVYSNYDMKLPFSIALFVESEEMKKDVKVSGFQCSAHSYPIDAREAFRISTIRTFENIVDGVLVVDKPLSQADIRARGLDAMVIVKVEDFDVDLKVIPGFWTAEMEADSEIAASISADTSEGRALGSSVEGSDDARLDAGIACDGGAGAVGRATELAIKKTMDRLGERLTNSVRLRELAAKAKSS